MVTMGTPAFATSLPLRHAAAQTPRRCRAHRFNLRHAAVPLRATLLDAGRRESEIEAVESRLRALEAPAAADLAYVALTSCEASLAPTWRALLDSLEVHSVTGRALTRIANRLGIHAMLALSPKKVAPILAHLTENLQLTLPQRNRIVAHRPDLLQANLSSLAASTAALLTTLQPRELKHITLRWPGILLLPAHTITRVITFLVSRPTLLTTANVRSLLRRAPWILVYDVDTDMAPAVHWLRDELLSHAPAPLATYLLASPHLLGTSRSCLHAVMHFLAEDVCLDLASRVSVVRQFPPLLTCSVENVLRPAADFLVAEVGLERWQLTKVVRAFPAVLTRDIDADMRAVVHYFRSRGISNVARLVTRLPPVLGYELETDIIPKTEYVEKILGLSLFEILKFPAYYSYDLRKRIEPRTRFLQFSGERIGEIGLNVALTLTDDAFCDRIGIPVERYLEFRNAYFKRHGRPGASRDATGDGEAECGTADMIVRDEEHTLGAAGDAGGVGEATWSDGRSDSQKRRKKRFRATLTRMPWSQIGEQ